MKDLSAVLVSERCERHIEENHNHSSFDLYMEIIMDSTRIREYNGRQKQV